MLITHSVLWVSRLRERNDCLLSHLPASSHMCLVGLFPLHAVIAKGWHFPIGSRMQQVCRYGPLRVLRPAGSDVEKHASLYTCGFLSKGYVYHPSLRPSRELPQQVELLPFRHVQSQRWRCRNQKAGRQNSGRRAPSCEASTWAWLEVLAPPRSNPTCSVCPRGGVGRVSCARSLCRGVVDLCRACRFSSKRSPGYPNRLRTLASISLHGEVDVLQSGLAISQAPLLVCSSPADRYTSHVIFLTQSTPHN